MNPDEPKLHGWITVEYARQLFVEVGDFLFDNDENFRQGIILLGIKEKCRSMTINAKNADQN